MNKTELTKGSNSSEVLAKIELMIEEGTNYIYPENMDSWKNLVRDAYTNEDYYGNEIKNALQIMRTLDLVVDIQAAISVLDLQWHTEKTLVQVRRIVFNYSKRGPEFISAILKDLSYEEKDSIQNKKIENDFLKIKYSDKVRAR